MKKLLLILLISFAGCQPVSKIEVPIPGDGKTTLTGKAADDYAQTLVNNVKTVTGRTNEMFDSMKRVLPFLIITLVGGLAFWGYTRSRFGWVIPAAAIGGILFIVAFARWAEWITLSVILISIGILVWKAVEYQKERNAATK